MYFSFFYKTNQIRQILHAVGLKTVHKMQFIFGFKLSPLSECCILYFG
jgi:hypothetical protein